MSSLRHALGDRLVPMIDRYVVDSPDEVYASIPRSQDLCERFRGVMYR